MAFVYTLDEESGRELRGKVYDYLRAIEANGSLLVTEVMVYDHDFPAEHESRWSQLVLSFEDEAQLLYDPVADHADIMSLIAAEADLCGETVKFGLIFGDPVNTNCLEGIRCPRCGNAEKIEVRASSWFSVIDDGMEDHGDVEYDDTSEAACHEPECSFHGKWGEFQAPKEEK